MTTAALRHAFSTYAAELDAAPLSGNTRKAYRSRVEQYIEWLERCYAERGELHDPLGQPLARDAAVDAYRSHLADECHRLPSTVDACLDAIAHFYRFVGMERPAVARQGRARAVSRVLTDSEERRVLAVLHRLGARDRAIGFLLLGTGMRIAEIVELDRTDVVLDSRLGWITVAAASGGSRILEIDGAGRDALGDWEHARPPSTAESAYFVDTANRRLTRHALYDLVRELGRQSGVRELSARVVRDTFIAHLVLAGVTANRVNYLAGSARADVVRRTLAQQPGMASGAASHRRPSSPAVLPVRDEPVAPVNAGRVKTPRQGGRRTGNLLPKGGTFVGRDRDVTQVRRLLKRERLVTISGAAGMGKSWLAREVAVAVQDAFPDGAFLADLSASPSRGIVAALSDALAISCAPAEHPADAAVRWLRARQTLLILDNCDPCLDDIATLVEELLTRCPALHVIATAREALRVPGEVTWRLGPLAGAPPDADADAGSMPAADSVRLFVERARSRCPDIGASAEEAQLIGQICRNLDHAPLAIELAARAVDSAPLGELSAVLMDRLDSAASGSSTTAARHRSLTAALDWSYDRLDPTEQAVFRRLSLVSEAFGAELVEAVSGGLLSSRMDALTMLTRLAAKSLVEPSRAGSTARFHQLGFIRRYGRRKLAGAGEEAAAIDGLARWGFALVQPYAAVGFVSGEVARRWRADYGMLEQVHTQMRRLGDDRRALLGAALAHCWIGEGRAAEVGRLLAEVIGDDTVPPPYRLVATVEGARSAAFRADYDTALRLAAEAEALARDHHLPELPVLVLRGLLSYRLGDVRAAERLLARCVERSLAAGDVALAARLSHNMAWVVLTSGDVQRARAILDEVNDVVRTRIDGPPLAAYLHTCGVVDLERHDITSAEAAFSHALELYPRGTGHAAEAVEGLAIVAAQRGQARRSMRLAAVAGRLRRDSSAAPDPWWQRRLTQAGVPLHREALEQASREVADLSSDDAVRYALNGRPGGDGGARQRSPLTAREWEVAVLISRGLTSRDISIQLNVHERTIDSHLEHVRVKLGVRTRPQLAVWVHDRESLTSR